MREIRLYGSEGGGAEFNRLFLPLSSPWRRDALVPSQATVDAQNVNVSLCARRAHVPDHSCYDEFSTVALHPYLLNNEVCGVLE